MERLIMEIEYKNLEEVRKLMNKNYDANLVNDDDSIRVIIESLDVGVLNELQVVRNSDDVIIGVTLDGYENMLHVW